jgi:acetyl esterase/lipase
MRTTAIALGLLLALGAATASRAADEAKPTTLDVWPGPAPGEPGPVTVGEEKLTTKPGTTTVTSITNVSKPTLTVYRPARDKDTGVALVVFPGGGYTNLAWDHEGDQVGRWLNSIGVSAFVLKYRVPRRPGTPRDQPPIQALMDAQRSLSLVRSKADEWGVDSKRIGVVGFSAGGHLAVWASTNDDKRAYEPIDAVDKVSCRPDFAVVIYPGGVLKKGTDQLTPEMRVTSQTPPMFFVHAGNDHPESSVLLFLALKRAGVSSEMHIYATGGLGFGLRPSNQPCSTWPQRCEEWLRNQGVLKPNAAR